jgi:hypothetical protein
MAQSTIRWTGLASGRVRLGRGPRLPGTRGSRIGVRLSDARRFRRCEARDLPPNRTGRTSPRCARWPCGGSGGRSGRRRRRPCTSGIVGHWMRCGFQA